MAEKAQNEPKMADKIWLKWLKIEPNLPILAQKPLNLGDLSQNIYQFIYKSIERCAQRYTCACISTSINWNIYKHIHMCAMIYACACIYHICIWSICMCIHIVIDIYYIYNTCACIYKSYDSIHFDLKMSLKWGSKSSLIKDLNWNCLKMSSKMSKILKINFQFNQENEPKWA